MEGTLDLSPLLRKRSISKGEGRVGSQVRSDFGTVSGGDPPLLESLDT